MKRPDYGIDAPDVIRNLIGGGALLIAGGAALRVTEMQRFAASLIAPGACFVAMGGLMLLYARWGKFRQRDRILGLAQIKAGMQVLDVGCGRGLLAVGAARLGAKVIAVDVFHGEDLADNTLERTLEVIRLERVQVDVRVEDVRELKLESGSVDRIVSNLCLHNLYVPLERERGLAEIARVLKPGGRAVISDFRHVDEYARFFRARGLRVKQEGPWVLDTFPWLRAVVVEKAQ